MADKIAELSANGGNPSLEINIFRPGDLIVGSFIILLFDKADLHSTLIGRTDTVDSPHGTFNIPVPNGDLKNLDDCFIRYRAFAGDNTSVSGEWRLTIKIFQDNQIVEGGNILFKANLDTLDVITDKVRLNVS